jgi:hypothetical protein
MAYEERYVAFIDILGFREMVARMGRAPRFYDDMLLNLSAMRRTLPPREDKALTDLRVQTFSDSIVLSTGPTPDGLWHLLFVVHDLTNALLPRGIFIRGGVARGRMHHEDDILLGEAMVEAYDLESKVAGHPRIVLSKRVWLDAKQAAKEDPVWATYYSSRLIRASDGPAFLHVLCEYQAFNTQDRDASPRGAKMHPLNRRGEKVRKAIAERLEEAMDTPAHFLKVRAFAEYWNATVVQNRFGVWLDDIDLPTGEPAGPVLPFRGVDVPLDQRG